MAAPARERMFQDAMKVLESFMDNLYTPLQELYFDINNRAMNLKLEDLLVPEFSDVSSYPIRRLRALFLRLLRCSFHFFLFHLLWQEIFPSPLLALKLKCPFVVFLLVDFFTLAYMSVTLFYYAKFLLPFYYQLQEGVGIFMTSSVQLKRLRQARERVVRTLYPDIHFNWARFEGLLPPRYLHYKFQVPHTISVSLQGLTDQIRSGRKTVLLPAFASDQLQIDGFHVRLQLDNSETEWPNWPIFKFGTYTKKPSELLLPIPASDGIQTLDEVPRQLLSDFLRVFCASVPAGSSAVLHFSARNNTLLSSPGSRQHRIAKLGLCSWSVFDRIYKHPRPNPNAGFFRNLAPYTDTPLYTSIDDIVQLLMSGPTPLRIHSMREISKDYIQTLEDPLDNPDEEWAAMAKEGNVINGIPVVLQHILTSEIERLLWLVAVVKARLLSRWEVVVVRDK